MATGLLAAAGVLLVVFLAAALLLAANQRRFIYFPDPTRASPEDAGLGGYTAVEIATVDGERIVGWWRAPPAGAGVVLYLHGNGGNLTHRAARLADLAGAGLGVLAIDYRGYGGSTGTPSEAGLARDARAAYAWVQDRVPTAPVALFGESLGGAVAITLASHRPTAGLVLDSPFASVTRLARRAAPWLPVRLLLRDRYESEGRIGRVDAPVLIVHCAEDRDIPLAEARRLFEAAEPPKDFVALAGCGHIETWGGEGRARVLESLKRWTVRP